MSGKTGLDSAISIARGSGTYGAAFASSGWASFPGTETIKGPREYDKGEDLQRGSYGLHLGLMTQTTERAEGPINIKPASKGFGKILDIFHGNTVTSTGAGTAKTWVHDYGRSLSDDKWLDVQTLLPGTDGVDIVKSAWGMVGTSIEFTLETGKSLMCVVTLAGQRITFDEDEIGVAYPALFETFSSKRAVFTIDGAVPDGRVSKVTFKYENGKNTGRYALDGTGYPGQPLSNGKQKLTGTYDIELTGEDEINAFQSAEARSYQLACSGVQNIEGSTKSSLTLLAPNAVAEEGIPVAENGDVVTMSVPFEGYLDGTEPLFRATYVTTDTTTT